MVEFLFILFASFILVRDFSQTKGYVKAKILHFFSLLILFCLHIPAFKRVSNFHLDTRQLELVMSRLDFFLDFVFVILGIMTVVLTIGLTNRNEQFRRVIVIILPFLIPFGAYFFYLGIKAQIPTLKDYTLAGVAIGYSCIVYLSIFFIYRSKNMKDFFNEKSVF